MIDGIATLTIVASTMIIATPRLMNSSPHQRRRDEVPTEAGTGVADSVVMFSPSPLEP